MNNHFIHSKDKTADEPIVIADECGDSMWDAVLNQEVKACDVKEISINASLLLNRFNAAKECDATVAE
jgi:hypothetical protein